MDGCRRRRRRVHAGLCCLLIVPNGAGSSSDLVPMPPTGDFAHRVDAGAPSLGSGLSCNARDGLDLAGDAAFVWGSNFHVATACAYRGWNACAARYIERTCVDGRSQCCEACAAHRATCGQAGIDPRRAFWDDGGRQLRCGRARGLCNAFVFCAAPEQCFSYDVHVHRHGECWYPDRDSNAGP